MSVSDGSAWKGIRAATLGYKLLARGEGETGGGGGGAKNRVTTAIDSFELRVTKADDLSMVGGRGEGRQSVFLHGVSKGEVSAEGKVAWFGH